MKHVAQTQTNVFRASYNFLNIFKCMLLNYQVLPLIPQNELHVSAGSKAKKRGVGVLMARSQINSDEIKTQAWIIKTRALYYMYLPVWLL